MRICVPGAVAQASNQLAPMRSSPAVLVNEKHAVLAQLPDVQVSPTPHVIPQPPQLLTSEVVVVSQSGAASQSANPG